MEAAEMGAGTVGPGWVLRQERERMNLDVLSAANRLNLHRNVIEALEADDFASLPEAIFVRGYLRNYARLLGLDAEAMITRYEEASGVSPLKTTAAQSDRLRGVGERGSSGSGGGAGWLVVVVLLLGLAGGGLVWWQQQQAGNGGAMPIADTSSPADPAVVGEGDGAAAWNGPAAGALPEVGEPPPAAAEVAAEDDAAAIEPPPAEEEPAAVEVPPTGTTPAAEAAVEPAEPQAAADRAQPADAGRTRLVVRFSQDCWSQVVDSEGTKLLFRIAKAGETATVDGVPPIKALFGRANAVTLEVDGSPFDLAPYTQANIAKLTIGEIDPEADAAAAAGR
ncbi:hypothetical protein JCM17961_11930 [Endothiovibrio diazotrophicus]